MATVPTGEDSQEAQPIP
jgi:hypothetical protein